MSCLALFGLLLQTCHLLAIFLPAQGVLLACSTVVTAYHATPVVHLSHTCMLSSCAVDCNFIHLLMSTVSVV